MYQAYKEFPGTLYRNMAFPAIWQVDVAERILGAMVRPYPRKDKFDSYICHQ